jgi:hypothetical protein
MRSRIRLVVLLAFVGSLLVTNIALAKGSFDFLTVAGDGIPGDIRIADPALTTDWFVFADLPGGGIPAPVHPPTGGYVVTRYYMDRGRASAFDQLHYYPDAGLVYYDGIHNGWSEYDARWYAARPGLKALFEREVSRLALQKALLRRPFTRWR